MRNLSRALLAGGLGFAVSFIAGCGGGAGLLSGDQASGLNNQLNQVSSALAAGNCTEVQNAAAAFATSVANLPDTVSTTLRTDLDHGASTVAQAVNQCRTASTATKSATTPTTTTTSTTSTTKTTSSTTPTTATTSPTTTTTTTPATTPSTPGTTSTGSSGGGGLGGVSGSGGGSGGGGGLNGGNNGNG